MIEKKTDVYTMAEFFVEQHSNGHFILDECPFRKNKIGLIAEGYGARSVRDFNDFLKTCCQSLKSDSNLFWVALQSNLLEDTSDVKESFKEELELMKDDLTKEGWEFPQLHANMRNQINISNITLAFEDGNKQMQSSIPILRSASNIVGEIPILIKVKDSSEWAKKKDGILEYCVNEMNKKGNKNLVVLFNVWHDKLENICLKDIVSDLKRLTKNKTVLEYPSKEDKQKGIQNIKNFVENDNHILVTEGKYFNGCEASKLLFINCNWNGVRNHMMRSVENLMCIDVDYGDNAKINGMKEIDIYFHN